MYDTVNFLLTQADVGAVDFIEELPCYLNDFVEHKSSKGISITSDLGGLKLSANRGIVRINGGSICKWQLGDNLKTMHRADVQQAIERLSDTLHLPMERAEITRLDVAANVVLKHPTEVYVSHLGACGRAKRLEEPNGIMYIKSYGVIAIYDKIKEQKSKGYPIPELYRGKNVLRYEQRYKNNLPIFLKEKAVTAALLYDEAFYVKTCKLWLESYNKIKKINDMTVNFEITDNVKDFKEIGFLLMIEQRGGELAIIREINEAQKMGKINPLTACRMRKAVREACSSKGNPTVPSEAIEELDKKMKHAIKFCR